MAEPRSLERVWWSDSAAARAARVGLMPLEALYAAAVIVRGALYDGGLFRAHELALPAVSVGNLSVGGTGKTPIAAWLAASLAARGTRPAVILRGYGADEPLVHRVLNPEVPVVVSADRVAGVAHARELGATVAVLDDAFQHRRARRIADLVLVSVDRWTPRRHLLPAGPWREPLSAVRRASMVLLTRKAATPEQAQEVADSIRASLGGRAPALGVALLAPHELRLAAGTASAGGHALAVTALRGMRVLAVAAIADPESFVRQLTATGASVELAAFGDHHQFSARDVERLAAAGSRVDLVVCTLKDAVKLSDAWPRAGAPLWYVSQRVVLERGDAELGRVLDSVLAQTSSS